MRYEYCHEMYGIMLIGFDEIKDLLRYLSKFDNCFNKLESPMGTLMANLSKANNIIHEDFGVNIFYL